MVEQSRQWKERVFRLVGERREGVKGRLVRVRELGGRGGCGSGCGLGGECG